MALTLALAQRNSALDNILANLNNGYLRIYTGTRPATPDTALSGNTLLATLRFGATAFPAASGGSSTANAITQDSNAAAGGTASFYRAFKSDGTSAVIDGDVGTSGTDAIINTTSIAAGGIVACTSFTVNHP